VRRPSHLSPHGISIYHLQFWVKRRLTQASRIHFHVSGLCEALRFPLHVEPAQFLVFVCRDSFPVIRCAST